eukprot:GEZU01035802.1.p1 GENE.GEZU01035802.1~~GEZU01035802.1.p1  ORF type:complete len:371 (+),score=95.77 GEZU01035802.1:90-1202(+)
MNNSNAALSVWRRLCSAAFKIPSSIRPKPWLAATRSLIAPHHHHQKRSHQIHSQPPNRHWFSGASQVNESSRSHSPCHGTLPVSRISLQRMPRCLWRTSSAAPGAKGRFGFYGTIAGTSSTATNGAKTVGSQMFQQQQQQSANSNNKDQVLDSDSDEEDPEFGYPRKHAAELLEDGIKYLINEHQYLREQFQKFTDPSISRHGKMEIFDNIRMKLSTHINLEDQFFLPLIKKHVMDSEEMQLVNQCLEEHKFFRSVLQQLNDLRASAPSYTSREEYEKKVNEFMTALNAHLQSEEDEYLALQKKLASGKFTLDLPEEDDNDARGTSGEKENDKDKSSSSGGGGKDKFYKVSASSPGISIGDDDEDEYTSK